MLKLIGLILTRFFYDPPIVNIIAPQPAAIDMEIIGASLMQAVSEGDLEVFHHLLDTYDIPSHHKSRTLIQCLIFGRENMFEMLLEDLVLSPFVHSQALEEAIRYDRFDMFLSLYHRENLPLSSDMRAELIDFCIIHEKLNFFNHLLNGEAIDAIMMNTCLFHVINLGRPLTMLEALVGNQPFDMNSRGHCVNLAVSFNRPDMFHFLLDGHEISAEDRGRAFIRACDDGREEMFYILMENQEILQASRVIALLHAVRHANLGFINAILQNGPLLSADQMAPAIAEAQHNPAILALLIQA